MKIKKFLDKAFKIGSAGTFVAGLALSFTPAWPIGLGMMVGSTATLVGRQVYKGIRNFDTKGKRWKDLDSDQKVLRVIKFAAAATMSIFSGALLAGVALAEETGNLINKVRGKSSSPQPQSNNGYSPQNNENKYPPPPTPPPSSQSQNSSANWQVPNDMSMPPPQKNNDPINIETMDAGARKKLAEQMLVVHGRDETYTYLFKATDSNKKLYKLENGNVDPTCNVGAGVQLSNTLRGVTIGPPIKDVQEPVNANRNTRNSGIESGRGR